MKGNPAAPLGMTQSNGGVGVTDGFSRRSAGINGGNPNQMVQTFLSGQESVGAPISVGSFNSPMPQNESSYSHNLVD